LQANGNGKKENEKNVLIFTQQTVTLARIYYYLFGSAANH